MYTVLYEAKKQECENVKETMEFINYLNNYYKNQGFRGIRIKHETSECLILGVGSVDKKSFFFLEALDENYDNFISFLPGSTQNNKIKIPILNKGYIGCFEHNLIDYNDALIVAEYFLKNKVLPDGTNYYSY